MNSNQIETVTLKSYQANKFIVVVFAIFSLITGCATTGGVQQEPEQVVDVDASDIYPEWYEEGAVGRFEDGQVSGFAKAVGIETAWTIDNATRQAAANLKFKMDEVLETARREAETESDLVADTDFIRELRNAIDSLEPADYPLQSDSYEEDGVTYSLVRIDIPAEEALGDIERHLAGAHQQAWESVVGALN